jgi:hypothetical protein
MGKRWALVAYYMVCWVGAAIFTALWLKDNPDDLALALVVWSGGVLSVLMPQRVVAARKRSRS